MVARGHVGAESLRPLIGTLVHFERFVDVIGRDVLAVPEVPVLCEFDRHPRIVEGLDELLLICVVHEGA